MFMSLKTMAMSREEAQSREHADRILKCLLSTYTGSFQTHDAAGLGEYKHISGNAGNYLSSASPGLSLGHWQRVDSLRVSSEH